MSFDLFFYKRKNSNITCDDISNYLTQKLTSPNEDESQWFFENDRTEVYYFFEKNDPAGEVYEGFENTGFVFNLNYARPEFFGLEALDFVTYFLNDLDLYVINPQTSKATPHKPGKTELFQTWNKANLYACNQFNNEQSVYLPPDLTNAIWVHNYNVKRMQYELGAEYFVSKAFFFKKSDGGTPVTLSIWTEHFPNVLPVTDYYVLARKYKRFFKTIQEVILLSKEDFNAGFSSYFEAYKYPDTMIIHPEKAKSAAALFNKVRTDLNFEKELIRVPADLILNIPVS
jgi:hypothetical protein